MPLKYATASSRGISLRVTGSSFFASSRHLRLDRREVLGRERPLVREIVVEAVLDHRADRHLRVGKQLLHRVGEQVRGRVAQDLEALGILVGDDGERRRRGRSRTRCRRACRRPCRPARPWRGRGRSTAATSATVTGASKCLTAPSGNRMSGMADLQKQKKCGRAALFRNHRTAACELATRSSESPTRSRCHNHASIRSEKRRRETRPRGLPTRVGSIF